LTLFPGLPTRERYTVHFAGRGRIARQGIHGVIQILSIAAGGALGALSRFYVSGWVYGRLGRTFPFGTLAVNALGSLIMGLCAVLLVDRLPAPPAVRAFMLVGFLGAFTTFSTFSVETLGLIEQGESLRALLNVLVSVVICVTAAWVGMAAGRQL
jgi:CrcB protein